MKMMRKKAKKKWLKLCWNWLLMKKTLHKTTTENIQKVLNSYERNPDMWDIRVKDLDVLKLELRMARKELEKRERGP